MLRMMHVTAQEGLSNGEVTEHQLVKCRWNELRRFARGLWGLLLLDCIGFIRLLRNWWWLSLYRSLQLPELGGGGVYGSISTNCFITDLNCFLSACIVFWQWDQWRTNEVSIG